MITIVTEVHTHVAKVVLNSCMLPAFKFLPREKVLQKSFLIKIKSAPEYWGTEYSMVGQ